MNETSELETAAVTVNPETFATDTVIAPNVTVWLVDDNDGFRAALADLLGHQEGILCTRNFPSPDAVLSALASSVGPDVILLDIQMRDRNGLDAIGPIKALSRDTQVLMLTSSYDPEGYNRALAEGASDFLLKSYSPDQIVQRIRNPTRRVNARRNRKPNPDSDAASCRAKTSATGKAPRPTRLGLGLFRRWLGVFA